MENRVLESSAISSYFPIEGNQLYVTYDGQNFTCKHCGSVGHKQIDCNKRAKDFPIFIRNQDSSVRNPNSSSRQYDDSSAVKRQKVVQLPYSNKIGDKKSNTSKEISSEITEKMNNEPINLTKPFQFNDSEPINLTLLPEPTSHEPMETASLIEKMQHEIIGGRTNYVSCAVTVQPKIYLLPMKMVSLVGIAARNA